mmetsp:Transcript_90181/g.215386  ORF Transcript_90181/g.215386 Transcript_90181/m.215386 type:complete len:519 (+) Transcript_90181:1781-3337(+)
MDLLHSDCRGNLLECRVRLLRMHDNVVKDVTRHDEVQMVLRRHRVVFLHSLLHILQHGIHVALHLAFRDAIVANRSDLLDHAGQGISPVARICVHRDGGHGAALTEGVAVVDLHRGVVGAVPRHDAELQNTHKDAYCDQVPDVLVAAQRPHRSLGIEVQLQALQELISEDAQRSVPGLAAAGCIKCCSLGEGIVRANHRQAEIVELLRSGARDLPSEQGARICRSLTPDRVHDSRVRRRHVSGSGWLKHLLDACNHFRLVQVSHNIEGGVAWIVPLLVKVNEVLLLPGFDLLLLADGELRAQLVGLVQARQRPGLDAVFHVIHLLHLREDRLALLLDAVRQHLWGEGDLVERLQGWNVHAAAVFQLHGSVDMIDGVLEVCQRIGARTGTNQPLAFAAAQKANMLHHVSNALLVWVLVNAADVQLNVGLKALWRHRVAQDHIAQPIGQHSAAHSGMERKRLLLQLRRTLWPIDETSLRGIPVALPVEETQVFDLLRQSGLCCNHRLHHFFCLALYILQA